MSQGGVDPRTKEEIQTVQGGAKTWSNPTGRVSVQFAPGAVSFQAMTLDIFPPVIFSIFWAICLVPGQDLYHKLCQLHSCVILPGFSDEEALRAVKCQEHYSHKILGLPCTVSSCHL